jgi:hypothetical protein
MMQERERSALTPREAAREVVPGTAVEPHPPVALADDAEAVVLDFVNPPRSVMNSRRFV